jgi:hypothetical protein
LGSLYFHSYSETSLILWNREIHYLIYNSSPLVAVVIQMNPIYMQLILKIRFNILFTFTPRFFQMAPFLHNFPPKICTDFTSPPYIRISHVAQLISPYLIILIIYIGESIYPLVTHILYFPVPYLLFLPQLNAVERMLLNHKIKTLIFHF